MSLRNTIATQQNSLQILSFFTSKYNLDEVHFNHSFDFVDDKIPSLTIHCYDTDRESILVTFGDALGRDGWTRKLHYGNESFHWEKTVDSVKVVLYNAELIGKPEVRPVSQSDFPIQIKDIESVA